MAAALAAVAALSGCSWTSGTAYFPQPTEAEVGAAYARFADANWEFSGLGDRVSRPEVAVVHTIDPDDWSTVMAECMIAAGYPSYLASGGGLTHESDPTAPADAEALAMFVCQSQYPYDREALGVVGVAQERYLYRYYIRWLIPCLGLRGYDVGPVPSETAYLDSDGEWSPYSALWETLAQGDDEDELVAECQPMPVGFLG